MGRAEKDFEVTVRLRNNRLKERRLKLGYNQAQMAMVVGIPHTAYGGFECLAKFPLDANGEWTKNALKIAEYFDCGPEELFPDSVLKVDASTVVRKFDGAELHLLMSGHSQDVSGGCEQRLIASEEEGTSRYFLRDSVAHLTPIEADVVQSHFGFDRDSDVPLSVTQISEKYDRSTSRIAQIRDKALRKMRGRIMQLREGVKGQKRFELCYLDVFEEGEVDRIFLKVVEAVTKVFPGVPVNRRSAIWLFGQIELRAYGFEDFRVQEKVAGITREVLEAEQWKLKPSKSAPQGGDGRLVVEVELFARGVKKQRFREALRDVFSVSKDRQHCIARLVCHTIKDSYAVIDKLLPMALNPRRGAASRPIYNRFFKRTVLEMPNGSAIDVVCRPYVQPQ